MEEKEASKPGLWKNFTETTGFHGLNKMTFDKKYPGEVIRSVCWAVVWLFSVAVLIYIITTELMNYYSYPWISSTYTRWDQNPPFPVVTLADCSGNEFNVSMTTISFDGDHVNISDVPVVEYTDFISFDTFYLGLCSSRRFNANGKMLTLRYGRRTSLQIETRAKELQIAVHSPEQEPEMYTLDGISVGEDTETFIEVHKRETKKIDKKSFFRNYDFNTNNNDYQNIMISVFLKDFTTTVTEQIPKYDGVTSLLANLGGQMGLFLGASILTMTELLEFIIFIMWSLIQRRSKRNVVQEIPLKQAN
ncbi:ACCN4 [Mytilus edulis]|uniref:ASIC4 n=1 Tax=Mytilus edulis TaxID=6550 RepID=A0A8S3RT91_MYTED|nr:ACCN4 [Mytilus edulis]